MTAIILSFPGSVSRPNQLAHNQGDLKAGSVGPTYPFTVSARGNPHSHGLHAGLTWYVWHTGTGKEYGAFPTSKQAHELAERLKQEGAA